MFKLLYRNINELNRFVLNYTKTHIVPVSDENIITLYVGSNCNNCNASYKWSRHVDNLRKESNNKTVLDNTTSNVMIHTVTIGHQIE